MQAENGESSSIDTLNMSGLTPPDGYSAVLVRVWGNNSNGSSASIGTLVNSGTLKSGPSAISVSSGVDGTAKIQTIENLEGATINSTSSNGIDIRDPGDKMESSVGTIDNAGTISGAGSAIYVNGKTAKVSSIQNTGTISGATGITVIGGSIDTIDNLATGLIEGTDGTAIDLSRSSLATIINNAGKINGAVKLATADLLGSILNLQGNDSVVSGEVTGGAGSVVNVLGDFRTSASFAVGQFNIGSEAKLEMSHDITVKNSLKNDGTLYVPAGKAVVITGDYVQGAHGVFQTGVKGTSGATQYGQLQVTGNADLSANNKMAVLVTSADTIKNGQLSNVLQADGTLNIGTVDLSVEDTSALWKFTAIKDGNSIHLKAELVDGPPGPGPKPGGGAAAMIESTGIGTSALGAAHVIDQFLVDGNATGDMQVVLNNLGALSTDREVALAVSQMIPAMTGEMAQISLGAMQGTNRVVQARMEGARGLSSGDAPATGHGWIKPFGSWADQGDRDGVAGYRSDTYGFVVGADKDVGRDTRMGAAFSYANTKVNGNAHTSAKVDTYQVIFYGSHSLDARTDVNFQADVGMNQNSTSRRIRFGDLNRNASADYDSWNTHLGLGIGRQFDVAPKTVFTPSVRADYLYVRDQSYTERGADALSLQVDSKSTDALIAGLDGKIDYAISDAMALSANVGVGYDALASRSSITSTFVGGGAAFVTRGSDPAPWLVRGGLGVSTTYANGMELALRYDVEGRKSFTNQTASLKLRMPF
jgi:outer membrane autotransporter protein